MELSYLGLAFAANKFVIINWLFNTLERPEDTPDKKYKPKEPLALGNLFSTLRIGKTMEIH